MIMNPKCQKKAQEEIERVIGERRPKLSDKPNLPYIEATYLEALRCANLVPIFQPFQTQEDTQVLGFKVPKNTNYLVNVSAIHHDPTVWEKPGEFLPERFFNENAKTQFKYQGFLPFGTSK